MVRKITGYATILLENGDIQIYRKVKTAWYLPTKYEFIGTSEKELVSSVISKAVEADKGNEIVRKVEYDCDGNFIGLGK